MSDWEPKIVAFLCNWCSYGAADLAGINRLQYPTNIKVIRIPCTGRMSPKFILAAFGKGADGVWVSGCHPGDCHYMEGNYYARRKFTLFKNLIEHMGIEPGRLHFSWISSAEGTRFAEIANKVTKTVKNLGSSRHLIKKINAKVD
ncbi:MAG: hydrogenase iron-sulfur subunit [Desulfobacterales bacterium]|uniref:Hydrogenase iron-sulfur subunit n=1 Tax=Candidatus Desulfaltia bathyphila TaxID=2841697 RepID=A0A8J6N678_9BACT|nr:hydrogenase iron-sulfur subunit [Candidatus Desulfaltia bathyphila]MBL7195328.1 hydrogenase iron-sulfur subunit [Desulfobacterales bacterium]MBL7207345.1 hydrogenase iron-sulfur subunit [Desulfobacterales bacterium]